MKELLNLLMELLFPPKCMLCRRLLDSGEAAVCPSCLVSELPELEREAPKVEYFEKSAATFRYEEPVIGAILRFKFQGMASYAQQFGSWMAGTIRDKLEGQFDLISWVPCSRRRIWSRGFDQAELLARAIGKELGMEPVRTLRKLRHNPKQSRTKGAARRKANVLGAYGAWKPEQFRGKRILLIDDVLTTGATLSECGKTLRLAGAGELVCAVLASAHTDKISR